MVVLNVGMPFLDSYWNLLANRVEVRLAAERFPCSHLSDHLNLYVRSQAVVLDDRSPTTYVIETTTPCCFWDFVFGPGLCRCTYMVAWILVSQIGCTLLTILDNRWCRAT